MATRTAISTTCPPTAMTACPAHPKTRQMVIRGPIRGIVSGSGPRMVGTTKQTVSRCTQAASSRVFPMTVCPSNAHLRRCTTAIAGPMPRATNGSTSAPAGGTSTTPRTTCCPSSTCPAVRTALSARRSIRLRAIRTSTVWDGAGCTPVMRGTHLISTAPQPTSISSPWVMWPARPALPRTASTSMAMECPSAAPC